jgi:UDPglucose 6-dehydrogenase
VIVEANTTRKYFTASDVLTRQSSMVGIYRLIMTTDLYTLRMSSVQGGKRRLQGRPMGSFQGRHRVDQG